MDNLPIELLIELLLKTNSKKELMNLCSTSKKIYNLCKSEPVAKHIMKDLIKLKKPDIFLTYSGFLKHYIQRAKILHPDSVKYDSYNFYNYQLPNMVNSKGSDYIKKYREKFP